MKYEINNFCGMSPLTVSRSTLAKKSGMLVVVQAFAGGFCLSHTMRPAQAREMAAALIACADAQEQAVNAEFAAHRESLAVMA